jgi:ubiquinol-cytochrome c reductase cytochrome b subunit
MKWSFFLIIEFNVLFKKKHIGRGLYYNSYKSPRVAPWSIGVIILVVMMATAFLGYVLPYGQMSLWGEKILICLICFFYKFKFILFDSNYLNYLTAPLMLITPCILFFTDNIKKLRGHYRIGPHNEVILSFLFGSLLGDAYAEKRGLTNGGGTRISFYQESTHGSYLLWLHENFSLRGYCNANFPKITTRLGEKGKVRKIFRFHTWTYTSFNWIHDLWYKNNVKIVPLNIGQYLTPLALAVWIMDDGSKVSKGLKLSCNAFTYSECVLLVKVLNDNFGLKSTVQSAGADNQYHIYIWKESIPLLRKIISPYIIPSMKYKIIE